MHRLIPGACALAFVACGEPIEAPTPPRATEPVLEDAAPAAEPAPEKPRGPAEPEPTRANLRPVGVPADSISAAAIQRSMRERTRNRHAPARRYPITEESQTDVPALLLSRITVSEEGWANEAGMRAILQVARSVRGRACNSRRHSECADGEETILSALRRLSPTVSGFRNPMKWRTYWVSTLPAGDTETGPRLWRECGADPSVRCDGAWRNYRARWVATQAAAARLLGRTYPRRACAGQAMAWGCRDCGDDSIMHRRNRRRARAGLVAYVALACAAGVRNRIWGIPPAPAPSGPAGGLEGVAPLNTQR